MRWGDFLGFVNVNAPSNQEHLSSLLDRTGFGENVERHHDNFSFLTCASKLFSLPASPQNERGILAFIGELYNAQELKKELNIEAAAEDLDPLIILSALSKWGMECFSRLKGIFSLAIHKPDAKETILYRDPIGARGLYYHFNNSNGLTYSNRLPLVAARHSADEGFDASSLHEYLRFLDIAMPRTIYKNIFHLNPGSVLLYKNGRISIQNVETKAAAGPGPAADSKNSVSELDRILRKSVSERLDGENTGCFLSGGLDSGLVTAIASDIARDKIEAFTVGFSEKHLDEAETAARVAAHLRIKHHKLYFDEAEYRKVFDKVIAHMDYPYADPASLPTFLKFDLCKERANVFIDGTGADGLAGQYPGRDKSFAVKYASKIPYSLRQTAWTVSRKVEFLKRRMPTLNFENPAELFIRWWGWERKEIERLCGCRVSFENTTFFETFRRSRNLPPVRLYSALLRAMPDDRIHEAARVFKINLRFPYWDDGVKSFFDRLDDKMLYADGVQKKILRDLYQRYVPSSVWNSQKQGFNFPLVKFMRQYYKEVVEGTIRASGDICGGLADKETIFAYMQRFKNGDDSLAFKIWAIVVFQGWAVSHKIK